jgi:hypothetical protein
MTPAECAEIHALIADSFYRLYGDAGTPVFKKDKVQRYGLQEGKAPVALPLMARITITASEHDGD